MTLPDPFPPPGLNIFADNVYLQPPAKSLDEHADDVLGVLSDDMAMDRLAAQLRQELIKDLTDAEFFRTELRQLLDLSDRQAAAFSDAELVAELGLQLQRYSLDWDAVNRVTKVVEDFPADWSAEDLARAVRSALHPLSTDESQVTAALPAVTTADAFSAQQPALTQLPPSDHPDGLRS